MPSRKSKQKASRKIRAKARYRYRATGLTKGLHGIFGGGARDWTLKSIFSYGYKIRLTNFKNWSSFRTSLAGPNYDYKRWKKK